MNFYRDDYGRVNVQAYDRKTRRMKRVSRKLTSHLDKLPDEEVARWVAARKPKALIEESFAGTKLWGLKERWFRYLEERGYDRQTITERRSGLEDYVFYYFAHIVKTDNVRNWPEYGGRFYNWLTTEGAVKPIYGKNGKPKLDAEGAPQFRRVPATAHQVKKANTAFKLFYAWLGEEGEAASVELKLRAPLFKSKGTPLPRPVSPNEVLEWAKKCKVQHVALAGLIGYFFSLRPQETFALQVEDFRGGADIEGTECVKVMKEVGLYNKLAVYIKKQKQQNGKVKNEAKADSMGWVACFNQEAAELIVQLVEDMQDEDELFEWNNSKLYDDWRAHGIPSTTLKDMRRASLYWLGHYTEIQPLQLMKHARHKKLETTMLYCRRPNEAPSKPTRKLSLV